MTFMKSTLRERSASNRAEYDGPLFDGKDRHALSKPAFASALDIFAANGVERRAGVRRIPLERALRPLTAKKLRPSLPRPRATDAAHGTVPIDLDQCAHAVK